MKKWIAILLVTLCFCGLILTACTGEKTGSTDSTAVTTGNPTDQTAGDDGSVTTEPGKDTEAGTDPLYDPDTWSKNY